MPSVLHQQYITTVVPLLKKELALANVNQVPRIQKVTVNVGYGRHVKETAYIETVEKTLTAITGQKPIHNAAKKSISNFKTREGLNIGISVTLRGKQMYEFLYRLIHLTLPRVRDFRGLSPKSVDSAGNYSIGFTESLAFPEVTGESADTIFPLQVVITTNAKNRDRGLALLKALGFPFKAK